MRLDALLRAADILRAQPCYAMPLAKLHACLTDELGPGTGSYADIYLALKKRPQSFMVLEPDPVLEPGLGNYVHVTLIEDVPPAESGLMGLAAETISDLWQRGAADPVLHDYLARASTEIGRITSTITPDDAAAHPTTHPRDPRL